jgi:signal transduction histidine kinase
MTTEFPVGGRSPEELRERLVAHATSVWWWIYFPATLLISRAMWFRVGLQLPPELIPGVAIVVALALISARHRGWRVRASILIVGAIGLFTLALASAGPTMTVGVLAMTVLLWTAMFFGRRSLIAMSFLLAGLYWAVALSMVRGLVPHPGPEMNALGTLPPWVRIFIYSALVIPPITATVQVLVITFEHAFARERRAREEERRQRDELQRATHELEVAQQRELAGTLASGLAHDMRNSLHVIGLNAEYLLPRVEESHREMVLHLKQAADQSQQILRDLVEFAGKHRDESPVADVRAVTTRVTQLVGRILPSHTTLEVVCEADGNVAMRPGRLAQALVNLVLNARDATPEGGVIALRVHAPDASTLVIAVADGGIGMSDATRARLFDPYFTTKPAGKGTGLGLFMVQRAVRDADGTIAVQSAVGQGTTFTITLPRVA